MEMQSCCTALQILFKDVSLPARLALQEGGEQGCWLAAA
jgi:hypothetical protein